MAIVSALAAADVGNLDRQDDLAISYDKIGETLQAKGDLAAALAQYAQECAIRKKALDLDPASARRANDFAACSLRIGALDTAAGDTAGAGDAYGQARDLLQGLVDRGAADAAGKRILWLAWEGLGDLASKAKDLKAARSDYQAALDIAEATLKSDPTLKQSRSDVAIIETRAAVAAQGLGDAAGAAALLADALQQQRALAARGAAGPGGAARARVRRRQRGRRRARDGRS